MTLWMTLSSLTVRVMPMRAALLLLMLLVIQPDMASAAGASRSDRPAFKGVELYSWVQQGVWQFAICPGTNRNKTFAEISTTCQSIGSMETLKASLANLAMQENVVWSASLPELKFPRAWLLMML